VFEKVSKFFLQDLRYIYIDTHAHMASITITSNISDMDGGSGAAYAVCFQDSEFTDVANVDSTGRAAVIRYVMDHKDDADGPVVPMAAVTAGLPQFSATLETELANVDSTGPAIPIDFGVTNHHAYVVTRSGTFENAFHVKHVPITITGSAATEGWRLFVRDYPYSDDFQYYASAAGDFGYKDTNLNEPYSMMNSFYTGKEGFTDADIKTDGYYLFRWNFYLETITAANRIDPNTGSRGTRWLQWTQTNNPFTEPRAGFANSSSGSDINPDTSSSFLARELGLSESDTHAVLDATYGEDFYWCLGTKLDYKNSIPVPAGSITGMTDDSLGPNGGTECWMWFGPKPNPSDLGTI